jgi:hypothetical protein
MRHLPSLRVSVSLSFRVTGEINPATHTGACVWCVFSLLGISESVSSLPNRRAALALALSSLLSLFSPFRSSTDVGQCSRMLAQRYQLVSAIFFCAVRCASSLFSPVHSAGNLPCRVCGCIVAALLWRGEAYTARSVYGVRTHRDCAGDRRGVAAVSLLSPPVHVRNTPAATLKSPLCRSNTGVEPHCVCMLCSIHYVALPCCACVS